MAKSRFQATLSRSEHRLDQDSDGVYGSDLITDRGDTMYRKSFLMLALSAVAGSAVQAQVPTVPTPQPFVAQSVGSVVPGTGPYRIDVVTGTSATPIGSVPVTAIPQAAPAQIPGVAPIGQPLTLGAPQPSPGFNPQGAFSYPPAGAALPPSAVYGPGNTLTQGIPIPAGSGPITSVVPQPTAVIGNLYGQQPIAGQQPQIYTPTYYYYYYQQQQQPAYTQPTYTQPTYAQPTYAQPTYAQPVYGQPPVMFGGSDYYGAMPVGGQLGPMYNFRGESGHVRYPYHSYRRPWYFPGQPSFNVTIDGPVW